MYRLILRLVEIFANKLTSRLDAGSKVAAVTVKGFFVLLAAAPFVWIYFNGGQYLGREPNPGPQVSSTERGEPSQPLPQSSPKPPSQSTISPKKDQAAASTYINSRFGFRVAYPTGVLYGQGESENGDGQVFSSVDGRFRLTAWASRRDDNETVGELYDQEGHGLVGLNQKIVVTYRRQKDNWFVVSGTSGEVGVYRRTMLTPDYIARIEMRWKLSETSQWRSTMESVQLSEGRRR